MANKFEMLRHIMNLTFRPFDDQLWAAFSGCDSDDPLYAEDDRNIYILDGNTLSVIDMVDNSTNTTYELKEV